MPDIINQLDCIFKPKSVAVIGASENIGKWGHRILERTLHSGFTGSIFPVNPQSETILGLPAFKSIKDIPSPVELAIFTIPAQQVPAAMQECVEKGLKGAILISAGFAETGKHGKELEETAMRIARAGGVRCVGPNCMGIWSAATSLNNAFNDLPKKGNISFISQSGTIGIYMSELAKAKGYGLRTFLSTGNEADLTSADYIEYLANDDETKVIILYMEGVKNGKRFVEVCRDTLKRKPILLYKGGSSQAGARATLSHTASIAGSDIIFESVCKQLGLIRTEEPFETFEMAIALLGQPLPPGRRVGILGTGGQGVVTVDDCQHLGLDVPELDKETSARLMKMLPAHAPLPRNPVDFAGSFHTAVDEANVVETMLRLDYIDGVISSMPVMPIPKISSVRTISNTEFIEKAKGLNQEGVRRFIELPHKYGKPVICARWIRDIENDALADQLIEAGIPIYDTPAQAARAMYALVRHAETRLYR